MIAGLEDVGSLGPSNHSCNGNARTQALCQGHHVGLDASPLVRKPLACSAHAALNFVNHHEPIFFIAKRTDIAQIVQVHGVHTPFALNGFKKYSHHIGIVFGGLLQFSNVIDRNTQEALNQGTKSLLNFGIAGGTQGGNAAPVKSFFINHDDGLVDAFVVSKLAR